jgi:hypothetical protein
LEQKDFVALTLTDVPGAGTHTYKIQARNSGGAGAGSLFNSFRSLAIIETKR